MGRVADNMVVRELLPERYHPATALLCACVRHRTDTPASWQREDANRREGRRCNLRWEMVASDDALAGYAAAWEVRPRRFRFDLVVAPERRRQGLGAALFETVFPAVRSGGAEVLLARADAADSGALAFLHAREFREVHRRVTMRRGLAGGAQALPAPTIGGLEIHTAVEGARLDPGFWSALHAVHVRAAVDWPDFDPGARGEGITRDQFGRLLSDLGVHAARLFVARVDGSWAGYTGFGADAADPRMACTGPTATGPDYRGRGIATALKATALAAAARAGFEQAQSRSANPALLRVNTKLGFAIHEAEVRLARDCAR
jgi:GNAT superfamily N-acetyltransferase